MTRFVDDGAGSWPSWPRTSCASAVAAGDGRDHRARSDAVLRRDGRPDGRPRRDLHAGRRSSPCIDVQKNKGGKFMHYGKVTRGSFAVGDTVEARGRSRRAAAAIMRAHSATHLLASGAARRCWAIMRIRRAPSSSQTGCAYDFTHFSAVTPEELRAGRAASSATQILAGLDVDVREMPIEEAKKAGAMALFGEKYGDVVRVVNMGGWFAWSSAAARIWTTPQRSARSASRASPPSPPACAASRRSPVRRSSTRWTR